MKRSRFAALALLTVALLLPACDSAAPDVEPPIPDLEPLSAQTQAEVVTAFREVEALFDRGWPNTPPAPPLPPAQNATSIGDRLPGPERPVLNADTSFYTGYASAGGRGYLVTLNYREPQGVSLWSLRLQHGTVSDGATGDVVETVALTFITYDQLAAFVSDLEGDTVPYLTGSSADAAASFTSRAEEWTVTRLAGSPDGAQVSVRSTERAERITIRDPVITIATDGSATVRDGLADGSVRTRYYGSDFAVDASGTITAGTLVRTLLSGGDASDGAVVSRTEFPDGSFRQTRQRGGDGVVIRENSGG